MDLALQIQQRLAPAIVLVMLRVELVSWMNSATAIALAWTVDQVT